VPQGGTSLWLRLPRGTDDTDVAERALSHGVAVLPGTLFTIGETGHPHLRLAYGGIGIDAIDEAIRRLADVIESVAQTRIRSANQSTAPSSGQPSLHPVSRRGRSAAP
jgi:DNA-binding transcriptional MocR family regulator